MQLQAKNRIAKYGFAVVMLLMLTVSAAKSQAQTGMSRRPEYLAPAPFNVDVFSFRAADGNNRLDLYLRVFNNMLTFAKQDSQFVASYEVVVDLFEGKESDSEGPLLLEKVWSQTVMAPSYEISVSRNRYHETFHSFEAPESGRVVRIQIRDKESDKAFVVKRQIQASPVDADSLGMSSVALVTGQRRGEKDEKAIAPNLSGLVYVKGKEKPMLYYELYNTEKKREKVTALYTVFLTGREDKEVDRFTRELKLTGEKTEAYEEIPTEKLTGGDYAVAVAVKDKEDGPALAEGRAMFRVRVGGLAANITNLMEAIEQLRYITDSKEIDYILEGKTNEEKLTRFNEFWRKRDPSPGTEENELMAEYYDRILYANQHFRSYMPGWRTDMGMIYIKYGAPDFVDRRPSDASTRAYEIWEYYTHRRRFIFLDMTGFGDFRLAYPEWDIRNRTP